jgi:hypothetical protein
MSKEYEEKEEIVKQGRIRRRGKMGPGLGFRLTEEQKVPRAFYSAPRFSKRPALFIPPSGKYLLWRILNSAPAIPPSSYQLSGLNQTI